MHLPWRDAIFTGPAIPGYGPAISTSITAKEVAVLADLARDRWVLEVGAAYGYSSIAMALAGATHIVSVDPHQWLSSRPQMVANLNAYGVSARVEIVQRQSGDALPGMAQAGERYGLIFIDGDHSLEAARRDLLMALPLLEPGGALAVHDTTEDCCCPGVKMACDQVFPEGPESVTDSLAVYHPVLLPAT